MMSLAAEKIIKYTYADYLTWNDGKLKGKKWKVYSAPFDIRLAHNAKITDDELVQHVLQPIL
jgi:hypothetical protein